MSGGSKKQTVGYRYYMGLHMGICAGPVDAVLKISAGDREAWSGNATSSQQIMINAPDLFGGEEREGGIDGQLDLMFGEDSQSENGYLASQQEGPQPGYRGFLGLVFRQGLVACNNPYIKPWAVKVRRILKGWQNGVTAWYPEKAAISLPSGDKAMNPAHIVYECLTNLDWGLGYGAVQINDARFRAAADRFYAEGLGLCILWTKQDQLLSFIQTVVDHAAASLNQDPTTGLFVLDAIRDGYDAGTLPVLDPSCIDQLQSFQRAAPAETTNELTVKFVDSVTGRDGSVTVQNIASISSQGGVVAQTKQYPGIPNAELATRIAMRDLRALSSPVARVRLTVNRKAYKLMPGGLFRFVWPKLGITGIVMRVGKVGRGTLENGSITIEAVEDVFSLPSATYVGQQPSGWQDPSGPPQAAAYRLVQEAGFYDLQRELGADAARAVDPDSGYVVAQVVRPSGASLNFTIMDKTGSAAYVEQGVGEFCPSAVLLGDLLPTQTTAKLANVVDGDLIAPGTYAQVESEIVRVDAWNRTTGAITLGRGVLDSVATRHPDGARLFFIDGFGGASEVERVASEVVSVKTRPKTGRGVLAESAAPVDVVTMAARAYRPYPPGKLQVNGERFPDQVAANTLSVSWVHRNRLSQNLEGDESGNIGPEPGTTYAVTLRSASSGSVVQEKDAISATSYTFSPTPGSGEYIVEVRSVRNGYSSRQASTARFTYSGPALIGWGRLWGKSWGTTSPTDFSSYGGSNKLPLLRFAGRLLAMDYGIKNGVNTWRLYESTDDGQTWGVSYEGTSIPAYGTGRSVNTVVGGVRLSFGASFYAGWQNVITSTSVSSFTVNADRPVDSEGNVLSVGALYSDGTMLYAIGQRRNPPATAYAEMRLYSSTDGLTFTSVGVLSQDPADPNALPDSALGAFKPQYFSPSNLLGERGAKLQKAGSRWFLVGDFAIYYTDESPPLGGWKRCPTGLHEGAPLPGIILGGMIQYGSTLVAFRDEIGISYTNTVSFSTDNGTTWTPSRPSAIAAGERLRNAFIVDGKLFISTYIFSRLGVIYTTDPSAGWSFHEITGYDNNYSLESGFNDGTVMIAQMTKSGRVVLVRTTDGFTYQTTGI